VPLCVKVSVVVPRCWSAAVAKHDNVLTMQIQDSLEASFVSEAEMVFTTLSSTGRKVCPQFTPKYICNRFHSPVNTHACKPKGQGSSRQRAL
jgi:hypothetical protein